MKIKLMPMLVGAIALSVAVTPLAVKAATNTSGQLLTAQAQRQGRFAELNLSKTQKDEIKKIHQDMRSQFQVILTPDQLEKFKAARKNKQGLREAIAAMNLSDQQKDQLRTLKQSATTKTKALLTPEQQQQLQQTMEQRRQQRQAQRQQPTQ